MVVVVVAGVVFLLETKHVPLIPQPTSCIAVAGKQDVPLSVSQAGIASTIAGVAAKRELPKKAVTIAYAAALQESKLSNLNYGDRDSVGIFQQRPSQGWGTARQIENPVYATDRFFSALANVPGYLRMPVYKAAQAVQRSADGYAYGQYALEAADLATAFSGAQPHAFSCYYADSVGKPRLAAATRALGSDFGDLRSGALSDPAMSVRVKRSSEGWAVAAWLISHASSYGINTVRYDGYVWVARHGSGEWTRQAKPAARATGATPSSAARTQAAPTTVVFG